MSNSKTFHLPDLGEGLPDATIVEWFIKEGEVIRLDDPLVSMETAKAVVEVPSPISGKVVKLAGAPGDIVVTGFRQSLTSALNMKRNETASIDAIKAEDIAEFPDLNLAESLQRIPGVAISRVNGEGRNISVRGLGPEYTRVRINGMEAIGTSGEAVQVKSNT